jgi:hypothetical protein
LIKHKRHEKIYLKKGILELWNTIIENCIIEVH